MKTLVLAQNRQWLWFCLVAKAFLLALLTLLATFAVTHAQAGDQTYLPFAGQASPNIPSLARLGAAGSCMDDLVAGKLNCTANDVGLARFTVLNGITKCFEGESVDVEMRADLLSTSAVRYDIGFFVANDGGNALNGQCVRDFLTPPASSINGPYNPTSGTGPYLNADGNACGDIKQNEPTFKNIQVVTVQCQDDDKDGMLDVGTCASWANNTQSCTGIDQTLPSTPSKCKCGRVPVGEVVVLKTARLEVIKDVAPDDAPGKFDLLVDGLPKAIAVGDLGTTGVLTVSAGTNKAPGATHTVGEAASGTTNLADYKIAISCVRRGTNNLVAAAPGPGPMNVPFQPGDNIVCTVTNQYLKATLEIVKDVVPDNPATKWIFNVTGPTLLPSVTITGDGTTGARTVLAGKYTIAETAGPGTIAGDYVTTWSCTDGAARGRFLRTGKTSSLQVTLLPNQHVVCTYTNTRATGTILVSKLAIGGDDVFTMTAGPPPLPSAFNLSTTNGHAQTSFEKVPTGQYTISESGIPPGWVLDNVQCSETGSTDSVVVNGMATISLQLNEVVHCTFTNLKLAELRVTKVVNWNGSIPDSNQKFKICIQGPSYPTGTEPNACRTAGSNGGELVWSNLLPGSYQVNETTPDGGWTVAGSPVVVLLAPGQTETTTVRNTKQPVNLFISKGGSGFYTRTFNWTLDKQVQPAQHDLFFGDTAHVTYTVAATRSAPIDQGFSVQGSVVVSNTSNVLVAVTAIKDALTDGTPVALLCTPLLPAKLAPGKAILCNYAQPVSTPVAVTNVATVTVAGVQQSLVVSAEVTFGEPTTVLSDTILVNDSNGLDFTFGDTGSQSYPKDFECSAPSKTYLNTATIAGTTQSATASVTLNCYALEVQKSALPSYDQISKWEISKIAEPTVLDLLDGEKATVTYTVQVKKTGSYSDNFRVSGEITVSNPAPIPAPLATVYDVLSPSGVQLDVTCPDPKAVLPGGVYKCTYSSNQLRIGTTKQNNAFAVLQNGTEASGSAPVDFNSVPGNPINDEINVNDSNGLDFTFGDTGSQQYTRDFDCSQVTGYVDGVATVTFDNVAIITETGQQANASVEVTCRITPEVPQIHVIKSADPEVIVGSSGVVTYSLEVQNTGPVTVSLTSLTDNRFGDLTATANFSSTTCVLPPPMKPLDIYTCSFQKFITGSEVQPHIDVVTAKGKDDINQPVQDSDAATVAFDQLPLIAVDKAAEPAVVRGTSGVVTYTVTISNTGPVTVELTSLDDNRFGDLTSATLISTTTCAVPQSLDVGASYSCLFTAFVAGDEATPHINQVAALAYDKDLNSDIATDSETVTFDQLPLITLVKSAAPAEIVGPSGVVTFSLAVQNVGPVPVSLTILNDDRFGDLTTTDNISTTTCALPQQVAPLGFYNCSFQAFVTGSPSQPHVDTASVVGVDENGNQAAADDDATVTFAHIPPEPQLPQIDVIKSANPSTLVGTGGVVTFTLLVQNSGPVPVTLKTLNDDKFGNLTSTTNISSTTCLLPQALDVAEIYTCSFKAFVKGSVGSPHIDTVTAGGDDGDGHPVADTDDEIVTFVPAPIPPLPEITLTKSANPTVIQGVGGVVTFTLLVQNSGSVALNLTTLNDNAFGDLTSTTNISSTTCALPQALDPSEFYQCSFKAFVTGTENQPHIDIVTAGGVDDQNNPATDSDNATVVFDQLPELEVIKSAAPTTIQGIGGLVTFNVLVQNTGPVTLSLTTLNDDQFGDLSTTTNISSTTCLLPQALDVAEIYTCSFTAFVTGGVGSPHTNILTATGVDGSDHPTTNSDDATVDFADGPVPEVPEIAVIKSANPTTIVGPSGLVNFTVVVQNTGPVNVSLTSLNDNRFGDLTTTANISSTTCLLPQTLNVGAHYTCSFQATVSGTETQPHTDTVTVSGVDGSDNPVSASDNVTVAFEQEIGVEERAIEVIKSPNPAVVKGTGGVVTFTVSVQNIGTVALSLTTLDDDRFGDLTTTANISSTTCILPQPLGLAEIYNCTFQAFVTGNENTPHTNVVTATGEDNNQNPTTSTGSSTVIFDQLPQIDVTKSVSPDSFANTQGVATYAITVENTGLVTVSLEVLFDNRFDDVTKNILISNTTCVLPVVIDPGDIYRCVFRANVQGSEATPHVNTVTGNAYDKQRNLATDFDDAVVKFSSPTNLDEGEQPFRHRGMYLPAIP